MKLFRSDLEKLTSCQLFEISIKDLELEEHRFFRDIVNCQISIDRASGGYRITGYLITPFENTCDSCLAEFKIEQRSNIDIILSDNLDLLNNIDIDVVPFLNTDSHIDLYPIVREILLTEIPLRCLCKTDCKGMCSECGMNFNLKSCKCKQTVL